MQVKGCLPEIPKAQRLKTAEKKALEMTDRAWWGCGICQEEILATLKCPLSLEPRECRLSSQQCLKQRLQHGG